MKKVSNNDVTKVIHKNILDIAKDFHEYCKKEKLTYYIIGGTFLGAIRHKGFIPWDDDMDIAMPREDYEKFLNNFPQDKYLILNYKTNPEYKYYISKLCSRDYMVKERTGNEVNLFVDIFPIDGMPINKFRKKIHCLRILYHRMKLSFYYNDTIDKNKKRKFYEKVLIFLATKIPFKKIINPSREKRKIDKLLMKNSFYDSVYSGTIMGAYREREIVETRLFGKATLYKFEDTKLYGPEEYDEYLTHIYGDYMKIPKNVDRTSHCAELIYIGDKTSKKK